MLDRKKENDPEIPRGVFYYRLSAGMLTGNASMMAVALSKNASRKFSSACNTCGMKIENTIIIAASPIAAAMSADARRW